MHTTQCYLSSCTHYWVWALLYLCHYLYCWVYALAYTAECVFTTESVTLGVCERLLVWDCVCEIVCVQEIACVRLCVWEILCVWDCVYISVWVRAHLLLTLLSVSSPWHDIIMKISLSISWCQYWALLMLVMMSLLRSPWHDVIFNLIECTPLHILQRVCSVLKLSSPLDYAIVHTTTRTHITELSSLLSYALVLTIVLLPMFCWLYI
jgi:hypothetical protein